MTYFLRPWTSVRSRSMPTREVLAPFWRDWDRLTPQQQRAFRQAVTQFIADIAGGGHSIAPFEVPASGPLCWEIASSGRSAGAGHFWSTCPQCSRSASRWLRGAHKGREGVVNLDKSLRQGFASAVSPMPSTEAVMSRKAEPDVLLLVQRDSLGARRSVSSRRQVSGGPICECVRG
jgi:hypothetical protein